MIETGGADGREPFEPWLAHSWEFSDDRLELTFMLRPDARWDDGTPITCEDVRFTHRAQLADELAWSGAFIKQRIESVDCPDPHTAVFRYSEAYADQLLDANDNAIVPSSYAEVPFDSWAGARWEDRIRSCGPFKLERFTAGQEAVLVRDDRWWDAEQVLPDRVILRFYPDASNVLSRFLDGEVDLLSNIPPLRAGEVEAREDLQLIEVPSLSYTFFGWNMLEPGAYGRDRGARGCSDASSCRDSPEDLDRLRREHAHPILADPVVRRALTLAIDRQDIVDGVWGGHAAVGTSPIVSSQWAHDPEAALPLDPREAERLLDERGWIDADGDGIREKDGHRLELGVIVNADNQVRRDALERAAAGLSRVGVKLAAEPVPRSEFGARLRGKEFDGMLLGWSAGTRIDPLSLLHSRSALDRGNNFGSWAVPRSDRLLDQAMAATTREKAGPLWQRWQVLFRDAQPITILYEETRLVGRNGRVRGPRPLFLNPFQDLHKCWVVQKNPAQG